ncbi:hypothetical protein TYRP_014841 [Tyrophagus putrescentiae]|nr:hypothetical protein TYRP_014806 [Tyrophagus putrescentiae]KAH9403655.1 hypothetical protein TYRP_014841 [Tyrophagus putrescentiae]
MNAKIVIVLLSIIVACYMCVVAAGNDEFYDKLQALLKNTNGTMTLEQITAANVTFEAIAAVANPAYHNSVDWYRQVVHKLLELKRQSLVKAAQEAAASTSDSSMVLSVFFSFFCVICLMLTFELQ